MNKYFSIFFVFIALASCSKDGEAIHMTEVNNKWNKNQEQKFVLNIDDTQNPKDVIFVVRNNNDYPYSNLFLITYLKGENDKTTKVDTLNYVLAKPTGEWIGTGFGETKE
ncbi:MAG: gliding motility lipoprotein GldH, partial [Cloacibacterium sp.]|nr:gliding motility lipoprotein GldH [Cloacibacterium sp.]